MNKDMDLSTWIESINIASSSITISANSFDLTSVGTSYRVAVLRLPITVAVSMTRVL